MKSTSVSMLWLFRDIQMHDKDYFNKLLEEVVYSSTRRFMKLFNRLYPNNIFTYHELLAIYDIFKDYSLKGEF